MQKQRFARLLRRFRLFLFALVLLLCFVLLTVYSSDCTTAVQSALQRCGTVLIPSLFPFLILSALMIRCGIGEKMGALCSPFTRFFFRLPGCTAAVILMSCIGGYPIGARGIRSLLDRRSITEEQAQRLLCFCVGAGPGFVISAVGGTLFHNRTLGILLWVAQLLSALLLGFLSRFFIKKEAPPLQKNMPSPSEPFSSALVNSVSDSVHAMLNLCAFVILFGVLLGVANALSLSKTLARFLSQFGISPATGLSILPILLEVCTGTAAAASCGNFCVFFTSFAIGWGGLCVHVQIFSVLGSFCFSKLRFWCFRFLHGIFAGAISALLTLTLPEDQRLIFSSANAFFETTTHSIPFTLSLLLLIFIFLLSIPCVRGGNYEKKMIE